MRFSIIVLKIAGASLKEIWMASFLRGFCSFRVFAVGAARMRRVPSTIRNFSKMICRGWNAPRQLPKFPILLSQRQNSARNIRGNASSLSNMQELTSQQLCVFKLFEENASLRSTILK